MNHLKRQTEIYFANLIYKYYSHSQKQMLFIIVLISTTAVQLIVTLNQKISLQKPND